VGNFLKPFYYDYTNAVLLAAAQSLDLPVTASMDKAQLINALCRTDQMQAYAAVIAAAGE